MILITDRQGPDHGCYSTGEDAEPERDGHLVRYHLEWNALEKIICQLPTLDRSNLKKKIICRYLNDRNNGTSVGTVGQTKNY